MQFLIDECLSVQLVETAVRRGWRAAHVAHFGQRGAKDWELMRLILAEDWTFVTRNAVDFRGPAGSEVRAGLYHGVDLHAGLVCLVGERLPISIQIELFDAVLEQIGDQELVNRRIEAQLAGDEITIEIYALP